MTLIKPTRRDIVSAVTDQARRELWQESETADKRANVLQQQIKELRTQLAESKLRSARSTAKRVEEEVNALLVRNGFDRSIEIVLSNGIPGQAVELQVQLQRAHAAKYRRLRITHPRDTKKIEKLVAEASHLRERAQRLRETSRSLYEDDLLKGAVGHALGDEEAAALELLVKAVKKVSLSDPKVAADAVAIASARNQRR